MLYPQTPIPNPQSPIPNPHRRRINQKKMIFINSIEKKLKKLIKSLKKDLIKDDHDENYDFLKCK